MNHTHTNGHKHTLICMIYTHKNYQQKIITSIFPIILPHTHTHTQISRHTFTHTHRKNDYK